MNRHLSVAGNPKWKRGLIIGPSGAPKAVLANALHALRHAPLLAGRLHYNEMTNAAEVSGDLPWNKAGSAFRAWTDADDCLFAEWLQRQAISVKPSDAALAAQTIALEMPYHPVRAYLKGLQWDGVPRLHNWLCTYLSVPDTQYSRSVGKKWLLSAVARVYLPGCKADAVLVLEGAQGRGKSTALSILAGPWFTDRLSDIRSKDAAEELCGVWLVEIAELHSLAKADANAIKAYLSRATDRYRPSYGRRSVTVPRQCVFAATVNPDSGYLKDATGGRRFWPVECGMIDLPALRFDRDQIWAEALAAYKRGETWWLDEDGELLAQHEQADRYQGDAWSEKIADYVNSRTEVTVSAILDELGVSMAHRTTAHSIRVSRSLTALGFKKTRTNRAGSRPWVYRRQMFSSQS